MTFEEWNSGRDKTIQPAVFDAKFEAVARAAWEAATAAERERCASIADGIERRGDRHWIKGSLYDMLRRDIAAEIRREP